MTTPPCAPGLNLQRGLIRVRKQKHPGWNLPRTQIAWRLAMSVGNRPVWETAIVSISGRIGARSPPLTPFEAYFGGLSPADSRSFGRFGRGWTLAIAND
jgi:hypothetical protein